jgi:hypothetical protein
MGNLGPNRMHLLYGTTPIPPLCAGQQRDMHLGPLEIKLLTVVGQALPLHPVPSETPGSKGSSSAPEMLQAPEDWPLTARIIHKRFK